MSATGALVAPSCMIKKRWRRQGITYPVENHEEENQAIVSQPPLGHAALLCAVPPRTFLDLLVLAEPLSSYTRHYTHRRAPVESAFHNHSFDVIPTASNSPRPFAVPRAMSSFKHSVELPTWNLCLVATTLSAASSYDRSLAEVALKTRNNHNPYTFGWWAATGSWLNSSGITARVPSTAGSLARVGYWAIEARPESATGLHHISTRFQGRRSRSFGLASVVLLRHVAAALRGAWRSTLRGLVTWAPVTDDLECFSRGCCPPKTQRRHSEGNLRMRCYLALRFRRT
ncbi:hypothetical protein HMN09_00999000 [Mycena chlorophos]|uniref:Uncharacterized protein n=1 Tax=Mycena chlorophos TaxID=658473 RepID=A0A8H6SIC9_MYCCL|nr:hypothetical protein HMN09_00999000 [Mycena chlorophos]